MSKQGENQRNKQQKDQHRAQPNLLQQKTQPKGQQPIKYTVTEPSELMKFLIDKMPGKGRNHIKSLLSRKQVSVNNKTFTQYNHPLEVGQQVEINLSMVGETLQPQGLKIIYEDEDIIVINKQAGLLSIASTLEKEFTAYHQLMDYVKMTNPKNRIFVVHRLDRETSGIMMFAKSEQVQQLLQNSWEEAVIDRAYVVAVEGTVRKPEGVITSWLKESKTLKMYSSPTNNGGQKAVSYYKVLQSTNGYSLLEVRLETGRKNQIRVHMEDIGHPVVGDKKYGSARNPLGRLGLHARILAFYHPVTGKEMRFETDIPEKFLRLFRKE